MVQKKNYRVAVGTLRVPKLQAVEKAIKTIPFFRDKIVSVRGYNVPTGVSHMPLSQQETKRGAFNRSHYLVKRGIRADFYIGIEGGIYEDRFSRRKWWAITDWVYITNRKIDVFASGVSYEVPGKVSKEIVYKKKELSELVDHLTQQTDVRSKHGFVGELSWNIITREEKTCHMIIMAFSKFIHSLYQ